MLSVLQQRDGGTNSWVPKLPGLLWDREITFLLHGVPRKEGQNLKLIYIIQEHNLIYRIQEYPRLGLDLNVLSNINVRELLIMIHDY